MFSSPMAMVASWVFALAYPTYASFRAIETPCGEDDKQWLTFWVVYAFISAFEAFCGALVGWIPLYYEIKTLFVVWMVAPQTKGAVVVYNDFVKPFLVERKGLAMLCSQIDSVLNTKLAGMVLKRVDANVNDARDVLAGGKADTAAGAFIAKAMKEVNAKTL